jgi:hypothetical protein
MTIKDWLAFTVVAAIISTLGALLGVFLKDYIFSRSFEQWKQKQTLETLYHRYRDPLFVSATELASRVGEILNHYPTVYLKATVLVSKPERQVHNGIDDPYFQRYKLISTAYRFCAFLGWIELYRQDGTYLHSGNNELSKKLEAAVELVRADLADGQLNMADDWEEWRDTLIFREELRAIGESMIEARGDLRTIMGYCRYVDLIDSDKPSPTQNWTKVILNFLLDLESTDRDFRQTRLKRLVVHLVDLMEFLDADSIQSYLISYRKNWRGVIQS